MSTNHYFEEIIGFSRSSKRLFYLYVTGLLLSLGLTLAEYLLATTHALVSGPLILSLILLALAQFVVQIICFLHIDSSLASRERLAALSAIIVIVLILVIGSIWIMAHLSARMMADPIQMQQYMDSQSGL